MPHTITWSEQGLYRKFTDNIYPEEILKSNIELQEHPDFFAAKYIINDFTQVTAVIIDNAHTKIYASTDDIFSDAKGVFKIAIVAEKAEHISLANNYRDNMKNLVYQCEIFNTVKEAEDWVKV